MIEPKSFPEIELNGGALSIDTVYQIGLGAVTPRITADDHVLSQLTKAKAVVDAAVAENKAIYGVTTCFGGMADVAIPNDLVNASQRNLLTFLATATGEPVSSRHTRAAMLLRANVLLQGKSGVRLEIIDRLIRFICADAIPVVRELGSIGASGDLVPLATIGRAITGHSSRCQILLDGQLIDGLAALKKLKLEPIELQAKEGLALVNGTSFSSAIAANCVYESQALLAMSLAMQAMMLRALNVQHEPFAAFVHQNKPHAGQLWTAKVMREFLGAKSKNGNSTNSIIQDRYSLRCLPQYFGPIVDGIARVSEVITTEMNSVTDNPLIDSVEQRFYQNGNFLGQYVAIAMDDLRRFLGLLAKHLDVQIAQLVSPEFNHGLPPSLRGDDSRIYNMGLKGLQITGNSIMPLLTYFGNPITEHFPTHAEQFNQNINGLSWTSANMAWRCVDLFQDYMAVASLFAIQAVDLRAEQELGHFDGRALLQKPLVPIYDAIYAACREKTGQKQPFLGHDDDRWLEADLQMLKQGLKPGKGVFSAIKPLVDSFKATFEV